MRDIKVYDDEREVIVTFISIVFAKAVKKRHRSSIEVAKYPRLHIEHKNSYHKTILTRTFLPRTFFSLSRALISDMIDCGMC